MLWDLIRDFFVQHIFGGTTKNGTNFAGFVAFITNNGNLTTYSFRLPLGDYSIGLGDWLSTTATIISITIIVVLCCLFVYKIIKLIGGLIR